MENNTLKNIFKFLEDKEGYNAPFIWKWKNNEPLTEEDLNVKGDLDLSENEEIESLPEGLKIEGNLLLYDSSVELPKGLEVGGNLHMTHSIYDLPKGLKVGGDLYLLGIGHRFEDIEDRVKKIIYPGFIKGMILADDYDPYDDYNAFDNDD